MNWSLETYYVSSYQHNMDPPADSCISYTFIEPIDRCCIVGII